MCEAVAWCFAAITKSYVFGSIRAGISLPKATWMFASKYDGAPFTGVPVQKHLRRVPAERAVDVVTAKRISPNLAAAIERGGRCWSMSAKAAVSPAFGNVRSHHGGQGQIERLGITEERLKGPLLMRIGFSPEAS